MRILAFVDLHADAFALRELERKARQADLILCAGDISVFETGLDKTLKRLDSFGKPMLMIHGNHEGEERLQKACKATANIEFFHKKAKLINNTLFIAYGGGGFEKNTPDIADFFRKNKEFLDVAERKVFMFHAPPLNTRVDKLGRNHNGNQTETDMILKYTPDLVICGHFHENFGKSEKIGKGLLVNPGPLGWLFEI